MHKSLGAHGTSMKTVNDDEIVLDEFFVCECSTAQHTLRFQLIYWPPPHEHLSLTALTYLNQFRGFWSRLWVAVKYTFKLAPEGGGIFDEWLMLEQDSDRLIAMLQRYKTLRKAQKEA